MKKGNISSRRWLIIPIETKARELHAKILLSCVAAERGWGVMIGQKRRIKTMQELLPKAIYLNKSISPASINEINRCHACGNRMTSWDEEGLLYLDVDDYRDRRISLQSFDAIDYFFAWGNHQANVISLALNRSDEKIIRSGNPRFDLLRPELRGVFAKNAHKIRQKYGNIILINTKFGAINSKIEGNYIDMLKKSGKLKTAKHEAMMMRVLEYQKKIMPCFFHMIPLLSQKFPNHTIIIRPHPGEKHAPWNKIARNLPNVKVVFKGNANEWILASDVMIHNTCTTGIEAFLLEKPAISYRPYKDEIVEPPLPNRVSYQASTEEELVAELENLIFKKSDFHSDREKRIAFASEYIANIDGKLACERILDVLDKIDLPKSGAKFPIHSVFRHYAGKIIQFIKPPKQDALLKKKEAYSKEVFPGLSKEEIEEIVKEFQWVSGRFSHIRVVPIDNENNYCLYVP